MLWANWKSTNYLSQPCVQKVGKRKKYAQLVYKNQRLGLLFCIFGTQKFDSLYQRQSFLTLIRTSLMNARSTSEIDIKTSFSAIVNSSNSATGLMRFLVAIAVGQNHAGLWTSSKNCFSNLWKTSVAPLLVLLGLIGRLRQVPDISKLLIRPGNWLFW